MRRQDWNDAPVRPAPRQEWREQPPESAPRWEGASERASMRPPQGRYAPGQNADRVPMQPGQSWERAPQPAMAQGWRDTVPMAASQPQGWGDRAPARPKAAKVSHGRKSPRRFRALPFVLVLALVAALSFGSFAFVLYRDVNRQNDVFYDGVYASGVHLGGMTQQEAYTALSAVEQERLTNWKVGLRYNDTVRTLTAAHIDLKLNLEKQLDAAWSIGRYGDLFTRWKAINGLRSAPYESAGDDLFDYNKERLEEILLEIQGGFTSEASNASMEFVAEGSGGYQSVKEQYGSRLDIEPIRAQILESIGTLTSTTIMLEPEVVAPAVTMADLEQENGLIVSVATPISKNSEEGRTENIRVALSRIDGKRVDPGKKFSFNAAVGKRTLKNGFYEAPEIEYGEYTRGVGGGVCQVSTTLYQAVVRAGLRIDKREPHAIPANYAEMGQDATVTDGGKDFVFYNDTDSPIYIEARLEEGKQKRCIVEIYGKPLPDGIRYVLESKQVGVDIEPDNLEEIRKDTKQEYVKYTDQRKEVTKMRLGHKIETYLITQRSDGVVIDQKKITTDVYQPKPAVVYVGVTPRD